MSERKEKMFLLYVVFWIILNGKITLEIILFGFGIAAALYWFICKYMNYNPKTDLKILKNLIFGLGYIGVLIWEIVKANLVVIKLIYTQKYEVEPVVVTFRTDLKSETARFVLANSITLTPGTITVTMEGNEFCVHCLDREMADGLKDSIFVHLLRKMEA